MIPAMLRIAVAATLPLLASSCSPGQYYDFGLSSCQSCMTGQFQETDYGAANSPSFCDTCGGGTYQDVSGSASCKTCPGGQYYPSYGGATSCMTCFMGQYSDAGDYECTACPAGMYSVSSGSTSCFSCLAGYYNSGIGNTACSDKCPAGQYSSSSGSSSCTFCPGGQYSSAGYGQSGSTSCSTCAVGTVSAGGVDTCTNCGQGQYAGFGASSCTSCSSGWYQMSTGASSCTSCPAGQYAASLASFMCTPCDSGKYIENSGQTSCKTCAAGYYCMGPGDTSATACPVGSSQPSTGAFSCFTCDAGKYQSNTGSTDCTSCDAGKYGADSGASLPNACSACPAAKYSSAGSTSCTDCGSGYVQGSTGASSCTACAAGKYAVMQQTCTDCEAGTFSASAGSTECASCEAGKYQESIMSTSCKVCLAGKYQDSTSATSCKVCVAGQYAGSIQATTCSACDSGDYQDTTGQSSCKSCLAGTYSTLSSASISCTDCARGRAQGIAGQGSCLLCASGKYTNDTGTETCLDCAASEVSNDKRTGCYDASLGCGTQTCNNTAGRWLNCTAAALASGCYDSSGCSCVSCPAGTSSSSLEALTESTCIACGSGQVSPAAGAASCSSCGTGTYATNNATDTGGGLVTQVLSGAIACQPCPAGYFTDTSSSIVCQACAAGTSGSPGASSCMDCTAGSYSTTGSSACTGCPPGFAVGTDAQSSCTACSSGFYASGTGSTSCTPCPAGSAQGATGQSSCDNCDAGTFVTDTGATGCVSCAAGKRSASASGSSSCVDCDAGKISAASAASCDDCLAGSASASAGLTACTLCGAGSYATSAASTACTSCPAGSAQGATGQTSCEECEAGKVSTAAGSGTCDDCSGDSYSAAGSTACDRCLKNYYYSTAGSCEACPSGAVCATDAGSTQEGLEIDEDYWRVAATSVDVRKCHLPDACVGAKNFSSEGNGYCGEGYTGPLCAVCDADYYFSPDDLACLKCGQTTTISPTLVLFVLAIILVFLFAIINKLATNGKITTLTSEEELEAHIKERTKRAGEALAGALDARLFGKDGAKHIKVDLATRSASITKTFTVASAKENTDKKTVTETASVPGAIITASCATRSIDPQLEMTVKIKVVPTSGLGVIVHYVKELQVQVKVLLAFFQIAASIGFNCSIRFPQTFERFMAALAFANLDIIPSLGFQCTFAGFDYISKMVVQTLAPLALAAVLSLAYLVNRSKPASANMVAYMFLLLTFLVLPSTSTTLFHFFKCHEFPVPGEDSVFFLYKDYSIDCKGDEYSATLAYAALMILVYPVGIPAMYFGVLFRHRKVLASTVELEKEAKLGYPTVGHLLFLTEPYSTRFYWFETLECMRRLLLASIIGMASAGSAASPTLGLLISVTFTFIFADKKPYKKAANSKLAVTLAYSLVALFLGALLVKVDATSDDTNDQALFGYLLVLVFMAGPLASIIQFLASASASTKAAFPATAEVMKSAKPDDNQATDVNSPEDPMKALKTGVTNLEDPMKALKAPSKQAGKLLKETKLVASGKIGTSI